MLDRINLVSSSSSINALVCSDCNAQFADIRQLQSHRRRKHGFRIPQRYFARADGVCPACQTRNSRLRLLARLSDSRRTKCWEHILCSSFTPLSAAEVEELDALDGAARYAARKEGHTHPIASGVARTKQGKVIGHVTR